MAHQVFVSYASEDAEVARQVCATLEPEDVNCWIAPRDVTPGESWASQIMGAVDATSVLVVVLSEATNQSPHVAREVQRAVGAGIPVLTVRLGDVVPSSELEYFLGGEHWLSVGQSGLEGSRRQLTDAVAAVRAGRPSQDRGAKRASRRRTQMMVILLGVALAAGVGIFALIGSRSEDPSQIGQEAAISPDQETPATSASPEAGGPSRELRAVEILASGEAADGQDACGTPVPFSPARVGDGDPTTAWRVDGPGRGSYLVLRFGEPVRVDRIGIIPGYAKTDPCDGTDRFFENRIVTRVRYGFDSGDSVIQDLALNPQLQFRQVDVVTTEIRIEIVRTSDHGGRNYTPISEVAVYGSALG